MALKLVKVIADRHGEGKQLFERFLGRVELDTKAARFEVDARRKLVELLIDDL